MIVCSRFTFFTHAIILSSNSILMDPEINSSLMQQANFVRLQVQNVISRDDPTLAGSILRLAFHDATVRSNTRNPLEGGSDGSIRYELDWSENRGLYSPLQVVQEIYNQPFNSLPFADVLALAGAAAVEAAHGPHIPIKLGRVDVNRADSRYLSEKIAGETERSSVTYSLPSAALDSLGLRTYFHRLGMTQDEWIALMGSHGMGRHVTLTGMSKKCLKNLTRTCLEDAPVLVPFITSPIYDIPIVDALSNSYFQKLIKWNDRQITAGEVAFIPTDVAMVVDENLRRTVQKFETDESLFFRNFVTGYQKLVENTARTTRRY